MAALLTALSYAALVLLLGGVVARRWLTPGHPGLWTGAVGMALMLFAWGGQVISTLTDLGMTSAPDVLAYATGTATGRAMLTGLLGAVLVLVVEVTAWPAVLGLLAAGVTLWGTAGIGHGDGHGPWLRILHALHAGTMSVWVGGVLALATARGPLILTLARRFTPAALGSVLTLALTGLLMSTEHLPTLSEWWGSRYGQTLLLKLAVVALALLASILVRRAFARQRKVRLHLVREALVLVAVLGITGVLSNLAPPDAHGGEEPTGAAGHGGSDLSLSGMVLCLDPDSTSVTFNGVAAARQQRAWRALRPTLDTLLTTTLREAGVTLVERPSCAGLDGHTRLHLNARFLDPAHYIGFGGSAYTCTVRLRVYPGRQEQPARHGFLTYSSEIHSETRTGRPFETTFLKQATATAQALAERWQEDNPGP